MEVEITESPLLSEYVERASEGEEIIFTENGRIVARLDVQRWRCDKRTPEERERDWKEMLSILEQGINLGGVCPTKDEIYER